MWHVSEKYKSYLNDVDVISLWHGHQFIIPFVI